MQRVELTEPASFVGAFVYEDTDIPPGQTLTEWRRQRAATARAAKAARRAARRKQLRALVASPARALRRPVVGKRVGAAR